MPKYFCEYCGIYLTHSSPGGRKQHSHGRKHINNKIEYYSQFLYEFQQNTYSGLSKGGEQNNMPQQGKVPNVVNVGNMQSMPNMQNLQKMIIPISNLRQPGGPGMPHMQNIHNMPGM